MQEPDVYFAPWIPWGQRTTAGMRWQPGEYLPGRFPDGPPPGGSADPRCGDVAYIGETCGQTLAKRWYQFNRSAFEEKGGHPGDWTYARLYGADAEALYASAFAVTLPEPYASASIRFLKRRLIWEYLVENQQAPPWNSK